MTRKATKVKVNGLRLSVEAEPSLWRGRVGRVVVYIGVDDRVWFGSSPSEAERLGRALLAAAKEARKRRG